jgi:membrane-bound ClpP family serine protease
MTLLYAILLLITFYLLLIAEVLLPSGGLLGIAAGASWVAAVTIAFAHSTTAGGAMLVATLLTTPILIWGLLRAWPHTPIGRRMLNRRPGQVASLPPRRTTTQGVPLVQLIGRIGVAKTHLLPSGMIVIDGDRIDAVSLGMPIDAGDQVIVTNVVAGKVQVRPATGQEMEPELHRAKPQSPPALENSLESLDFE